MSEYANRKLVSDVSPNATVRRRTYPAWDDIRERSVCDFVNRVSKTLGAPRDRTLRDHLYEVVFSRGLNPFRYAGTTYSESMLLDMYYRDRRDSR
jgi:hypothetical protein